MRKRHILTLSIFLTGALSLFVLCASGQERTPQRDGKIYQDPQTLSFEPLYTTRANAPLFPWRIGVIGSLSQPH